MANTKDNKIKRLENLKQDLAITLGMRGRRLNNFIKGTKQVVLGPQEREDIKHILAAHMEQTVREGQGIRLYNQRSPKITLIKAMPILLALALTFTGGTALAANGSLPGDLLYPVKVNFNEKVRGALAFSGEAEATFQSEMAARRLEELQRLAASTDEEFEAELRESVAARFEAHSQKALDQIEHLKAAGNLEAAANASSHLEASLEAHEELIARLSEDSDAIRLRLQGILDRVHTRTEAAAEARANAVARVSEDTSARLEIVAETRAKQAEQAINAAQRAFDRYEDRLSDRVKAQVEAKIEAAQEAYANGQTALEAENYVEAFRHFQASIGSSEQAKVMMRVWVSFKLDIDFDHEEDADDEDEDTDEDQSDSDEDEDTDDEEANEDDEDEETNGGLDLDLDFNGNAGINLNSGGAGANGGVNAGGGVGVGL